MKAKAVVAWDGGGISRDSGWLTINDPFRWSRDDIYYAPIPEGALRHSDREQRWVDQTLFLSEM